MKAMAIELEPAEKLKQPAEHPENFDLFMARAIQINPKCKKKRNEKFKLFLVPSSKDTTT